MENLFNIITNKSFNIEKTVDLNKALEIIDADLGFQFEQVNWSNRWWNELHVSIAPWSKKQIRDDEHMIPGIDFFWSPIDTVNYLKLNGCKRIIENETNIAFHRNFNDPTYSIENLLFEYLDEESGYQTQAIPILLSKLHWKILAHPKRKGIQLYVPPWINENFPTIEIVMTMLRENVDYFTNYLAIKEHIRVSK